MSDLISRSALIKAIKKQSQRYCDCKGCDGKGNIIRVSDVMEILDEQPTVCDIECQINQLAEEYKPNTNFAMCCQSIENMAQIIDIAKIGWTKEQIIDWLQSEVKYAEEYKTIDVAELVEKFGKEKAQSNDGWIPCSEQLPECENKYGWVSCIVSVIRSHYPTSTYDICDSPYDENIVMHANYHVSQKIWHLESDEQLNALMDIEDAPLNCDYVIAWQPLPGPYKGE